MHELVQKQEETQQEEGIEDDKPEEGAIEAEKARVEAEAKAAEEKAAKRAAKKAAKKAAKEAEKAAAAEAKEKEEKSAEEEKGDDDTAGQTLATGGGDINPPEVDQSEKSADPVPEETPQEQEQADAAALEEAQKTGGEEDPDVDETALPQDVKQEDLDDLLNKDIAEDAAQDVSDHDDNAVEEALAGVVEDTLAAVGAEDEDSDHEEQQADGNTVQSTDVSV